MPGLSEHNNLELDILLKGDSAFLELGRQADREVRDINRQEDNITAWIVGLSAGAIAGVSAIPRLAAVPRWQIMIVFLIFGAGIVSGLIYRLVLHRLDKADRFAIYNHESSGIAFMTLLPGVGSDEGLIAGRAEFARIAERKNSKYVDLNREVTHWKKYADRLMYVPPTIFVLGVLAIDIVASTLGESNKLSVNCPRTAVGWVS
jgi:hypothetical protein